VRPITGKISFQTTYSFSYESLANASGINSTTKENVAASICSMVSIHTYYFKGFYFLEGNNKKLQNNENVGFKLAWTELLYIVKLLFLITAAFNYIFTEVELMIRPAVI
jgi:hypothetical protein